jgi:hypothetical protein
VYRYKTFTDKEGKNGTMLFGVSTRAYGSAAANQFLIALKQNRNESITKISQFKIPAIKIGN